MPRNVASTLGPASTSCTTAQLPTQLGSEPQLATMGQSRETVKIPCSGIAATNSERSVHYPRRQVRTGRRRDAVAVQRLSGIPMAEFRPARRRSLVAGTALEGALHSISPNRPHRKSLTGSGLFQEFDYFVVIPGVGGSQGCPAIVGLCIDIGARFNQNAGEVHAGAPRRPIQGRFGSLSPRHRGRPRHQSECGPLPRDPPAPRRAGPSNRTCWSYLRRRSGRAHAPRLGCPPCRMMQRMKKTKR